MQKIKVITIIFGLLTATALFAGCSNNAEKNESAIKGIRGVWLTNVDSDVLLSKENIDEAVALIDELGFNSIFVVTWNKAMTMYKSEVMKNFTGIEIDPVYGNRDPLQELIDAAHKKNIKVFAWFEFGFSSSYQKNGGMLLEKRPEWTSKNVDGNLVTKNGFDWMNGFHPEVQKFLLSLVCEVVKNYDIDGIQGDDRLPAMPSEAGYDEYTVSLYKKSHNGEEPPADSKDPEWLDFRADILNNFMTEIYDSVKAINKSTIVSMAPSVYPWSKEEYLQDWPTWIENNNVEILAPQCYRYDFEHYKWTLAEMVEHAKGYNLECLAPGILLNLAEYCADEEFIKNMVAENRKHGLNGEIYFFYEGLKKRKEFFKELYKDKLEFPIFN